MRWLTWPNVVTGSRLVLFVWFIWLIDRGLVRESVLIFVLAWGLDALDGWLARRLEQVTLVGYLFDKITDRIILFGSLLTLVIYTVAPVWALLVLTKDVVAAAGLLLRPSHGVVPSLGRGGKLLAALQGIAVLWVLLGLPGLAVVTAVVAVVGAIVGFRYSLSLKACG